MAPRKSENEDPDPRERALLLLLEILLRGKELDPNELQVELPSELKEFSPTPSELAQRLILETLSQWEEVEPRVLAALLPDDPDKVSSLVRSQRRYRALQRRLQGCPPPLLRQGDRVGDFLVESFIARGGMGEVYRARQVSLDGRLVALKVIAASEVSDRDRARFEREARVAASVHHCNLVEVYGYGNEPEQGMLFYAMRLVEGPTMKQMLEEAVRAGAAPAGDMRRAIVARFREVTSALAALHERGLIHRDVKPSNIVLEGSTDGPALEQPAVLVDFGLARSVESEQTRSSINATFPYAAPEQLLADRVDARADVFSLGVALHDLLSARRPSRERDGCVADGLEPLSRLVPDIDKDLEAVVAMAVEPDARWRYTDGAALAMDLSRWLAGDSVTARPLRGIELVRRWIRRHPAAVLSWSAKCAMAAILLFFSILGVVRTVQVISVASSVNGYLREGNLSDLLVATASVPSALEWVFPSEAEELMECLRHTEPCDHDLGTRATSDVIRVLQSHGEEAAILRAAQHLEHREVSEYRYLASYLLRALKADHISSRDALNQRRALPLVARLFFERPDMNETDASSSAGFRTALLRILEVASSDADRRHALTALSGCGTRKDLSEIVSWAEQRWQLPADMRSKESLRLSLQCIASIILRGQLEGPMTEPQVRELDSILTRTCNLATDASTDPSDHAPIDAALEDILLMASLASTCGGADHFAVPPASAPSRFVRLSTARNYRREEAEIELWRFWEEQIPDEESQLGSRLDPPQNKFEHHPCVEKSAGEEVLTSFDFRTADPQVAPGSRVEVSAVGFETEQLDEGVRGYAQLGIAGVSAIRVHFPTHNEVPSGRHPVLHVSVQKSIRGMLPFRGTAFFDVLLDGECLMRDWRVREDSYENIQIPLNRFDLPAPRMHTLELRLSHSSDTCLRVKALRLVLESQDTR